MIGMLFYKPQAKVMISMTAEQLTEKTNKFLDTLIERGIDPDTIYISAPSLATISSGGYVICHTITYRDFIDVDLAKKTDVLIEG